MSSSAEIGNIPSLKQLVYENLRERIISGELKPGTRLREEDSLSGDEYQQSADPGGFQHA